MEKKFNLPIKSKDLINALDRAIKQGLENGTLAWCENCNNNNIQVKQLEDGRYICEKCIGAGIKQPTATASDTLKQNQ